MTVTVYSLAMFMLDYDVDDDPETASRAKSMAFVTLAAMHLIHSYIARSVTNTVFTKTIFNNKYLNLGVLFSLILLVVACYMPGLWVHAHVLLFSPCGSCRLEEFA